MPPSKQVEQPTPSKWDGFTGLTQRGNITIDQVPDGTKAVFLSDLQIPLQDDVLVNHVVKCFVPWYLRGAAEKHLFLAGDVVDLINLSRFPARHGKTFTLEDEITATRNILVKLGRKFTHRHYAFGNHEDRYERAVFESAPKFKPYVKPLHEVLELGSLGYDWVPYGKHFNFSGFRVTHGNRLGRYPAAAELADYHHSGCSGHVNRPQSFTYRNASGDDPITWYCLGMMCRTDIGDIIPDWSKVQPWMQGFGIAEVQKGIVHFQSVRVHHDSYMAAGRVFQIER